MLEIPDRYDKALAYAREAHAGVFRKGTTVPYLSHVVAVSELVLEYGGDEDQAIAGLLHDVAEDAGGEDRLTEIDRAFGGDVAGIVRACSDTLAANRHDKAPWWDRKVHYLNHLAGEAPRVLLVSAADKVHNSEATIEDYRRVGEELWTRFNSDSGRSGQLWYQRRVSSVLSDHLTQEPGRRLAERLHGAVEELHNLVAASVGLEQIEHDAAASDRHARSVAERLRLDW